jgi:hypothetical protein
VDLTTGQRVENTTNKANFGRFSLAGEVSVVITETGHKFYQVGLHTGFFFFFLCFFFAFVFFKLLSECAYVFLESC